VRPAIKNSGLFTRPGSESGTKSAPGKKATGVFAAPGGHGTITKAKVVRPNCPACGADSSQISDGTCGNCGAQVSFPPRDDFKERINESLALRSFLGRHHPRNEDYGVAAELVVGGITYTVMIVSDGVSSAERSHLASEAACQTSREKMVSMLKSGEKDLVKVLTAGVDVAQKAVLALPCIGELDSRGNRKAAPEATFIAAIVAGGRATICWLGDCRAYSVARNGGATLLTKDHSWINLVVDAGEMSLADAMVAPEAHAIYQSLGPVDADNGGIFEPAFCTVDLLGARMLILCSDGFWNYGHPVQDQPPTPLDDQLALLPLSAEALTVAEALVKYANDTEGHDNITVVVKKLS
jgi:protein phosphatase